MSAQTADSPGWPPHRAGSGRLLFRVDVNAPGWTGGRMETAMTDPIIRTAWRRVIQPWVSLRVSNSIEEVPQARVWV